VNPIFEGRRGWRRKQYAKFKPLRLPVTRVVNFWPRCLWQWYCPNCKSYAGSRTNQQAAIADATAHAKQCPNLALRVWAARLKREVQIKDRALVDRRCQIRELRSRIHALEAELAEYRREYPFSGAKPYMLKFDVVPKLENEGVVG